jgi:hypothetical protein
VSNQIKKIVIAILITKEDRSIKLTKVMGIKIVISNNICILIILLKTRKSKELLVLIIEMPLKVIWYQMKNKIIVLFVNNSSLSLKESIIVEVVGK